MNDYMRALHQRFYREPDFSELEDDIENTRQEVRDCLDKLQRSKLKQLADAQNLLREKHLWPALWQALSCPGHCKRAEGRRLVLLLRRSAAGL